MDKRSVDDLLSFINGGDRGMLVHHFGILFHEWLALL